MTELLSYHLVGRYHDGRVHIISMDVDRVPEVLDAEHVTTMFWLCEMAGCKPVCTIRSRMENGERVFYHGYFFNPESPREEDVAARLSALVYIATDFDESKAKALADDCKVLDALGIA